MTEKKETQPTAMNAFELISMSRGLNLGNLFDVEQVQTRSFPSTISGDRENTKILGNKSSHIFLFLVVKDYNLKTQILRNKLTRKVSLPYVVNCVFVLVFVAGIQEGNEVHI